MAESASFQASCTVSLAASLGITVGQVTSLTITAFRRRQLQGPAEAEVRRALATGSADVSATVAVGPDQTSGVTSSLSTLTSTFAASLASTAGIFVTVSGVSGGLTTQAAPSPAPTSAPVLLSSGLSTRDIIVIAGSVVGSVIVAWLLMAVFYRVVEPRKFSLFYALAGSKAEAAGEGEVTDGKEDGGGDDDRFELGMGSDDSSSSSSSESGGFDGWDSSSSSGSSSGVSAWQDLYIPGGSSVPKWMAEPFALLAQPFSWMMPAGPAALGDVETGKRDSAEEMKDEEEVVKEEVLKEEEEEAVKKEEEVVKEEVAGEAQASLPSPFAEEVPSPEPAKKKKTRIVRRLVRKGAKPSGDAPEAPASGADVAVSAAPAPSTELVRSGEQFTM